MKNDKLIDYEGKTYKAVADYAGLRQVMKDNGHVTWCSLRKYGLTSNTLSALSHDRVMGQETIVKLCLVFKCQPSDLFTLRFEPQESGPTALDAKAKRRQDRLESIERRKRAKQEGMLRKAKARASRRANIKRSLDPEMQKPWNA